MTLPAVTGWMIDHRTADAIFSSGSNVRIDHCIERCNGGTLFFCHKEEKFFKATTVLKQAFIDGSNCLLFPDNDVSSKCVSVQNSPICKQIFAGAREAAIFITATAACRNYGVITNHKSDAFKTVYDLCKHFHIPVFTADEYFALV